MAPKITSVGSLRRRRPARIGLRCTGVVLFGRLGDVGLFGRRSGDRRRRRSGPMDAVLGEDLRLDLLEELRVLLEVVSRIFAALADALAGEAEPRAALLDDV